MPRYAPNKIPPEVKRRYFEHRRARQPAVPDPGRPDRDRHGRAHDAHHNGRTEGSKGRCTDAPASSCCAIGFSSAETTNRHHRNCDRAVRLTDPDWQRVAGRNIARPA
jgi:hypothetical protein